MKDFKLRIDNDYLGTALDSLPRLDEGGADVWNEGVDIIRDALSKLDIGLELGDDAKGVGIRVNVCEPVRELVRRNDELDSSLWDDGRVELVRGCVGLMVELEYICTRRDEWSGFLDYVKDNGGVINLNRAMKDGFKNVSGSLYRSFQRFSGNSSVRRMYCYDLFKALVAREMELKYGSKVDVKYHAGFYVAPGRGRKGQAVGAVLRGVDSMATRSREGQRHMWAAVRALQARVSKYLNEAVAEKKELADSLTGAVKRLKEIDKELAAVGRDKNVIAWREERLELDRHLETAKQALAALTRRKLEKFELSGRYMREYKSALRKLESRMPKSLRGVPKLEDEKAVLEKKKARLEGQVADLEEQLVPAKVLEEGVKGLPASVDEARQGVKKAVGKVVDMGQELKLGRTKKRAERKPKERVERAESGGAVIKTLDDLKANLSVKVEVIVTEKNLIYFEKNNDSLKTLPEVGDIFEMSVVRGDRDRFFSLSGGGWTIVVSRTHVLEGLKPRLVNGNPAEKGVGMEKGRSAKGRPAKAAGGAGRDGEDGDEDEGKGDDDEDVADSGKSVVAKPVIDKLPVGKKPDVGGFARETAGAGADFNVVITDVKGLRSLEGKEAIVTVTDRNLALLRRGALSAGTLQVGRNLMMVFKLAELGGSAMRLIGEGCAVDLVSDGVLAMLGPRVRELPKSSARVARKGAAGDVAGTDDKVVNEKRVKEVDADSDVARVTVVAAMVEQRLRAVHSGNGAPKRGELKSLVDSGGVGLVNNNRALLHVAGCLAEDYDEKGVGMSSQEVADALQMAAGDVKAAVVPLRRCFAGLGLDVKVRPEGGDIVIGFVPLKKE